MNKYNRLLTIILFVIVSIMVISMINVDNAHSTGERNVNYNPLSIGTSSITLDKNSVSIAAGSSTTDSYTVKLTSGTAWGTSLSSNSLSGFTISFSNNGGDPTYTGTMTVSVASTVSDGTYHVYVNATEYYHKESERGIRYDDPDIGVKWNIDKPVISEKA